MEDEEKLQFLGGNFQLHFHALEYKNMTKMFFFHVTQVVWGIIFTESRKERKWLHCRCYIGISLIAEVIIEILLGEFPRTFQNILFLQNSSNNKTNWSQNFQAPEQLYLQQLFAEGSVNSVE